MSERELPARAIEVAERMSESDIESIVAILDAVAEGDRKPVEAIGDYLYYHTDMFATYERLRHFAMMGCFAGGEFDPDQDERLLSLSDKGRQLQEAAHDILEAKTGRRNLIGMGRGF